MTAIRRLRVANLALVLAAGLCFSAGVAEADDYHRGARHHRGHHHHSTSGHGCNPVPVCTPCDGLSSCGYGTRRGRAFGGSWATLRRYLSPGTNLVRYFYVRAYFLRRYPHLSAEAEPKHGVELEPAHFLHPEYDVAAKPLTDRQHLNLGMWQLHLGDYKTAATHFASVPADAAEHPQATYGSLVSAMCSSDWAGASKHLAHLASIGDLRADDRLDTEGLFGERGKLETLKATVKEHVRWRMHDGHGLLAAGWLFGATGDARLAKAYLRKATRLLPDNAAAKVLLEGLSGTSKAAAPATAPKTDGERPKAAPPKSNEAIVADAGKPILVADSR